MLQMHTNEGKSILLRKNFFIPSWKRGVSIMWKFLFTVNKNLVVAIPIFLIAGFIFGIAAHPGLVKQAKLLIMPFTFLMVYPMMVTLNMNNLKKGLNVKLQATALLINFVIIPVFAFFLGKMFFADQPFMALGLLLTALLPTSGMTISWTGFAKGNMGAAINLTVIGLTLGSLLTPFYVNVLLGASVEVALGKVVQQILIIVFFPMLIGQITRMLLLKRYSLPEFKQKIAPRFPAASTIGVLGIVFVAMALKARGIMAAPAELLAIFIPLLLLYGVNYSLSTVIGKMLFERGNAIALVYGTVMRNLSIALAIAINSFGEAGAQAALVIALGYIIQTQSAAWYVKLTDNLFGAAPADMQG